jgi:hypothetical protein
MDKNGIIRTRPEGPRDYNTPKGQNRRSGPKYNSYFYIKCVKRVFFVHEKVFYAETKVEAV